MSKTNIYMLTRPHIVEASYCEAMTKKEFSRFRKDEFEILRDIVEMLYVKSGSISVFDGYEYSFSVPHVSFEMDLLKIDKDKDAINIELKSQRKELSEIEAQLKRNRHFLSFTTKRLDSYTVVRDENQLIVYRLKEDQIQESNFSELLLSMSRLKSCFDDEYEKLFDPRDYLASPINSPERFLKGQYFLTPQQEQIKKDVLKKLNYGKQIIGITGCAGTGKTLLLYDIARDISKQSKICVVHCGKLADGHRVLRKEWDNVFIPSVFKVSEFLENDGQEIEYLFVDEAHRLRPYTFDTIERFVDSKDKSIIFSYDYEQVLSQKEQNRNVPKLIKDKLSSKEYHLSEKIRTNKEVASFIEHMLTIRRNLRHHDYSNVTILWAKTVYEAENIIEYYEKEKNYKYINITPSQYYSSVWDYFSEHDCSHDVIGQEFDNVMIIMDCDFMYMDGRLKCNIHPNPDYLYYQLMFQAVSRARRKLAILVLNNEALFSQLLRIKNEQYD